MSKRLSQHADLVKWCRQTGLDDEPVVTLLWLLFAPPNLRFLFRIIDRLAHLQQQWPNQLGELPWPFSSPDSMSALRNSLRSAADKLDPAIALDFDATPEPSRGKNSPLYGYCLSHSPLWSALVISPVNATASNQFDRVLACIVGRVMCFIAEFVPHESYKCFLENWRGDPSSNEQPSGSGKKAKGYEQATQNSDHPLPHSGSLAQVERILRKLSNPHYTGIWQLIGDRFPHRVSLDELALALPSIAGVKPAISNDFKVLARALNLFRDEIESPRRAGFAGLRGSSEDLSDGRYLEGRRWLIHNDLPKAGRTAAGAIHINQLPTDLNELLNEDYGYDELTDSTDSVYLHKPEDISADMPGAALKVINKWHFQQHQAQNQVLEWSLDSLTSRQTELLLHELTTLPEANDSSAIIAKMLLQASFVSGRNLEFIADNLEVTKLPTVAGVENLTIAGAEIEFVLDDNCWRLPTKKPHLQTAEVHRSQGDDDYVDFLTVPDVLNFRSLVALWLPLNVDFVERKTVLPAPGSERDGVRAAMRVIQKKLGAFGITPGKLTNGLARSIYHEHGDLAWTSLWADWQPAHSRTILHYLSPEASVIEGKIAAQLRQLNRQTAEPSPPPVVQGKVRRVGMRNCPSSTQVLGLVKSYQENLKIDPGRDRARIQAYSNHYFAYHALFQSAALAYRARIDPDPSYVDIDGVLLAVFRDKDSEGYNRRLVAVPPLFREHHEHLKRHRLIVRGAFIDDCLASHDPQVIWFEDGRVIPFRPKFIYDTPPAHWPFKLNALRRRMRTRLLEKGAPGEVVDVWMGHWKIGNCPWMRGSGFQMGELETLVNHYIQEILLEDGWAPIPSMLRDRI